VTTTGLDHALEDPRAAPVLGALLHDGTGFGGDALLGGGADGGQSFLEGNGVLPVGSGRWSLAIGMRRPREAIRAPGFTLPDTESRPVALQDVLARGPAVLSFYRGRW